MFYRCSKLQVLDMSNLNLNSVEEGKESFYEVSNLEYLNIRGIILNNSSQILDSLPQVNLTVCQNTSILQGENIKYDCCFFYEDDISCKPNYIVVYYGSDYTYTNGYEKGDTDDKYREGIKNLKFDNEKINPNESFTIKGGSKLEI